MLQLLSNPSSIQEVHEGDIVTGTVITTGQNEVYIDIQGVYTGIIRGPELNDESGENVKLQVNDTAQATVLELENEQGIVECSFRLAGHKKAWEELEHMKDDNQVVDVKVVDANKGGLIVRLGRINGFLPVSQLTVEHYPRVEGGNKNRILERLKEYIGQIFKVKVMTVEEGENKLIVSERAAWEEKQSAALSKITIGSIIEGVAAGIVDFGVFVEFGDGLEGLLHISELAWQRIENPADYVKVGQKIKAQVIGIDGGKISLSVKRLVPDPWKALHYSLGQIVKGKVLKLNPFGAFVELDHDIHGLAHISELSLKKIKDPSEVLTIDDVRDFKIISLEPRYHRLGLSIRAIEKIKRRQELLEAEEKKESAEKKEKEKAEKEQKSDPIVKTDKSEPSVESPSQ